MAEIDSSGGGKHKGGKKKGKKLSTRVDFTPMVDLGFLLITFFMLTTSMNKPQTMEINMPVKEDKIEDGSKVKASQAITLLLANDNKIVYYFVDPTTGAPGTPQITNYSAGGIRATLLKENKLRNSRIDSIPIYKSMLNNHKITEEEYKTNVSDIKNDKNALIVVIKASDHSKYNNLVDILDEMLICNIGRYAVVDITQPEIDMLKTVNLE
ncbi:MAG: biopolymer transporter ExbD [Bacteroidia bacterium]|nr:biopolymer transporter ExbD [Bacteroidia bacterium]MCC7532729.1 biopolymer transporter ExbD [Bacteroidia bacterium]MCZ2140113.1 biopolymer transporter ExbD [Bacteroidia bacterium]